MDKSKNKEFRITIRFNLNDFAELDEAYRLYLTATKSKPLSFNSFLMDHLICDIQKYIDFMHNCGVFLNLSDKMRYTQKK